MLARTTTLLARKVVPTSRFAGAGAVVATSASSRFSSEAAAASSEMATAVTLNFSVPYDSIYHNTEVASVILPGVEGEYGVTPGHVPYVAQLKPGVVQILHDNSSSPDASEKYFVAGGYAFTHANSVTDVVCPEAVKLDDLDPSAVTANFEAAKSAYSSATAGSVEQAEAQIDMEVNKAMGLAIGLNLA